MRHQGRGYTRGGHGAARPPTGHADALELPDLIQAGGVVLAGVGEALVDVYLAARARVALQTLALEGPLGVDAFPCVLAWVGSCKTQELLTGHAPRCSELPPLLHELPSPGAGTRHSPSEHSSTSWLQAGPMYPEGHVQMALPLTGLVSQLEPSLQGLLMQASSRWHSKPGERTASARQGAGHASLRAPRPLPSSARGCSGSCHPAP